MLSSLSLSFYIILKCKNDEKYINHTKLQKLLYIAYGLHLAKYDKKLIDECPQIWPYGPVFENVFRYFKTYGLEENIIVEIKDTDIKETLDSTIDDFADISAITLSEWSHQINSPWYQTLNKQNPNWGSCISDDKIKAYFEKFL